MGDSHINIYIKIVNKNNIKVTIGLSGNYSSSHPMTRGKLNKFQTGDSKRLEKVTVRLYPKDGACLMGY